jgi:hypothetical protein
MVRSHSDNQFPDIGWNRRTADWAAITLNGTGGWCSDVPGDQTIRLIFDEPQSLRRILLIFEENEIPRSHEFVLRWSPNGFEPFFEIVRQQWNISPTAATREVEDYRLTISKAKTLELIIMPRDSGHNTTASLMQLRIA